MMKHYHRDLLNRVIKNGDYLAWANGAYGAGITLARCVGSHAQKIDLVILGEEQIRYVRPENVIVITNQIRANLDSEYKPELENEELVKWVNSL